MQTVGVLVLVVGVVTVALAVGVSIRIGPVALGALALGNGLAPGFDGGAGALHFLLELGKGLCGWP